MIAKNQYINIRERNQLKPRHNISDWELPPGEILAPMAGITDSPFRRLTRRFGSGLLYSECISAEGTRRLGQGSLTLARFEPDERPIAVQLFGSSPEQFADAAAIIADRFRPDMIDINCGCPVKRFVTRKCGGYLMQYPDLIGRIVEAVRNGCGLPVSVKLRSGYMYPDETAVQSAVAAEEAGASLVAVHGRYVRKAKKSKADWEVIGRVKTAVRHIPVIGNGDVFSFNAAKEMVAQTGCDRVMIGRWAGGRPWIFSHLVDSYPNDSDIVFPSNRQRIAILVEHYRLMLTYLPERRAVHRMRKHIGWYTHGMPGAARLRSGVMIMEQPIDVISRLEDFGMRQSNEPVSAGRSAGALVRSENED